MSIKAIYQIEAKVDNFISHWHFDINTPIEVLEQMIWQYVQHLAQAKIAQQNLASQQAAAPVEENKVVEMPPESKENQPIEV